MKLRGEISTEIFIAAPANIVWSILTKLEQYQQWNPFITEAKGDLKEGSLVQIKIRPSGKKAGNYEVKIIKIEDQKEFTWLGHFFLPYLCDGLHTFQLIPKSQKETVLVHKESFSGAFIPFFWDSFINTHMRKSFEELNAALKSRAEMFYRSK